MLILCILRYINLHNINLLKGKKNVNQTCENLGSVRAAVPTFPAVSCSQVVGAPTPRGVTNPKPVTTTRLAQFIFLKKNELIYKSPML